MKPRSQMSRWMLSLLAGTAVGVVAFTAPPLPAQESVTVVGEVIDLSCYLAKGSKGKGHKTCAQMCAKKGLPIGVLSDSGELLLLIEDHDNSDPYEAAKGLAGERVEVAGKKFSRNGMASIVVSGVTAQ